MEGQTEQPHDLLTLGAGHVLEKSLCGRGVCSIHTLRYVTDILALLLNSIPCTYVRADVCEDEFDIFFAVGPQLVIQMTLNVWCWAACS